MTNSEKSKLYLTLSAKRLALYAIIQTPLTNANREELGPAIQVAQVEFHLCNAVISELLNSAPMAYPGDAVVEALEQHTAALSAALTNSNNVAALATAVHQLVALYPT